MRITFTGHRPDKIADPEKEANDLINALKKEFGDELYNQTYIVGGCPGFDTIALISLISLGVDKNRILLAVPFKGFEKYAGFRHQKENLVSYNLNYTCGVEVKEVGGKDGSYGQKCFKRNIYMVDNSDVVFTNWDGSAGGTANTVKLAQKKNLKIINIKD